MTTANDPTETLRALGFRASTEAIRALLAHATKSKLSPAVSPLCWLSQYPASRNVSW